MNNPASQPEHDLVILTASRITGWWNEHSQPAPFPTDFFDPDNESRPTSSDTPPMPANSEHPF